MRRRVLLLLSENKSLNQQQLFPTDWVNFRREWVNTQKCSKGKIIWSLKYWFQSRRPSSAAVEAVVRFRQRVISGPCWGQAAMHLDLSSDIGYQWKHIRCDLTIQPSLWHTCGIILYTVEFGLKTCFLPFLWGNGPYLSSVVLPCAAGCWTHSFSHLPTHWSEKCGENAEMLLGFKWSAPRRFPRLWCFQVISLTT